MTITIDKAIKELEYQLTGNIPEDYPDTAAGIQLGIEALKEVRRHRRPTNLAIIGLLPGEAAMLIKANARWLPFLCQCKDCLEIFSLEGLVNGDNQILKLESHRRVVHNGNSTYYHRCGGNERKKGRLVFYPVLWFGRS